MTSLPVDVLLDVVRYVGHSGFRNLGPFIAAGPVFSAMVFDPQVLCEVNLDEFIFAPELGHPDSPYRPFLNRCVNLGHSTARYVVGLRLLATTGPSQEGIDHLLHAGRDLLCARFALGAFLCLCSNKESGFYCFESFISKVQNIEEAKFIGDQVCEQIEAMGVPSRRLFEGRLMWGTLEDIPLCQFNHEDDEDVCYHCFALAFCMRIQAMC